MTADPTPDAGAAPADPLEQLRERIRATQDAAEKLASEAGEARRAQSEGRVPPQGYRTPGEHATTTEEVRALAALLESLHALVPEELQQQLAEVVRQVLLLLRALIDWWVDRLEGPARDTSPASAEGAQDIPIA